MGTRSAGRKPDLPGSKTCEPISGMTYEDIWSKTPRNTPDMIFKFYKDQGSWSSFRQVVRHKDLTHLHLTYLNFAFQSGILKNDGHIVEYGCGVAPFMTTLLRNIDPSVKLNITITDVDCEHFTFAQYSLRRLKEDRQLPNINLIFETIKHDELPKFDNKIDVLFCFEVMEHVLSPIKALTNISERMNNNARYVENFIKHDDHHDDDGPDLRSARLERDDYYTFLDENFYLLAPSREESDKNPNVTRVWNKK
jgi:hypothetical protein